MKPLVIDLFCGLGGWSDGFLAEGYDCIGFDIERHDYGTGGYPGQLVLQDVHTIHGRQFKGAACIVASPPCQEFSYMAMPWKRAKQIAAALRGEYSEDGLRIPFPEGYTGSRTVAELTRLFDACFRIQREAIAATARDCPACGGKGFMIWYVNDTRPCERCDGRGFVTRYIPMVVENVKGAQPWVGKANANYGSFYLWGDVRSVGGRIVAAHQVQFGAPAVRAFRGQKFNPDGTAHGTGSWFAVADSKNRGARTPVWEKEFGILSGVDPHGPLAREGQKVPMNFHEYEKTGKPGRSFQSAAVEAAGVKGNGGGWYGNYAEQKASGRGASSRQTSSHSLARKAASAQIAKIPGELSRYIARAFKPAGMERVA